MNSIALELPDYTIIDPFNGKKDIEDKVIRATSKAFLEDPVRALRVARQAAQHEFRVDKETLVLMNLCRKELAKEPGERLLLELQKAFKARMPSIFFVNLHAAGLLDITFPELYRLGKIEYENKNYSYATKANMCLNFVTKYTNNQTVQFAALVSDIGKSDNSSGINMSSKFNHNENGLKALDRWDKRMTLPKDWKKTAAFIIDNHRAIYYANTNIAKVNYLMGAVKLPISIDEFQLLICVNYGDMPYYVKEAKNIIPELLKVSGNDVPKEYTGKQIGEYITQQRAQIIAEFEKNKK